MIGIPRDAPGSVACGRSGWPLPAICPIGHNRLIPYRLLKTGPGDRTPIYGRPFKCRACGSRDVTLFAIESQAELDAVQRAMAGPKRPAEAPTTHAHDRTRTGACCRAYNTRAEGSNAVITDDDENRDAILREELLDDVGIAVCLAIMLIVAAVWKWL
jgi:hypothetical protein